MRHGGAALLLLALSVGLGACYKAPEPLPPEAFQRHERVVTLAPNLAELVYTAGAGDTLVGVSAYSDYPAEVLDLPVIGDAFMIDQERLSILRPDLLLVWHGGTPAHVVDELRAAGYNVRVMRTNTLDDIARTILAIGTLTGRRESAQEAVESFTEELQEIRSAQAGKAGISVFYQVSRRPLFTVSSGHYISELIEMCGGMNVFANLGDLAPTIDVEAVVERDPDVMMASKDADDDAFAEWQRWPDIAANRHGNHFLMPADEIGRATTRLVIAASSVCEALDTAREQRGGQ